jgi:hypothetical protein
MGSSNTVNLGTTTVTTTVDVAAPKKGLAHSIANVVVSVSGAEVCDPDVGNVPDRPAIPRHVLASGADHVSSTVAFDTTLVGSATMDAVGGLHARIVTLVVATPPRPEHEIV